MLKGLGAGAAGGALTLIGSPSVLGRSTGGSILAEPAGNTVRDSGSMKITKVESIRFSDKINTGFRNINTNCSQRNNGNKIPAERLSGSAGS